VRGSRLNFFLIPQGFRQNFSACELPRQGPYRRAQQLDNTAAIHLPGPSSFSEPLRNVGCRRPDSSRRRFSRFGRDRLHSRDPLVLQLSPAHFSRLIAKRLSNKLDRARKLVADQPLAEMRQEHLRR